VNTLSTSHWQTDNEALTIVQSSSVEVASTHGNGVAFFTTYVITHRRSEENTRIVGARR